MSIRALIITGGKHHDFDAAANTVAGVLNAAGIEPHREAPGSAGSAIGSGKFQVIVLYTQGDQLDESAVESLVKFVRNGGGLVALHSANSSIKNDSLAKLIGSRFITHGPAYDFNVTISDPEHPIAHRLQTFRLHDELYQLEKLADQHIFLSAWADNIAMPLGYSREEGKGKVVYLANGHDLSVFANPTFARILSRSVRFAAGEDWSKKSVNVAAIGYGAAFNMGKLHLESCKKARMKAMAVCDIDTKRHVAAKTELGEQIQTFSNADDLLAKSDAELCIVITPHNSHADLAVQCMEAGRHVVTEKPFTITVDEATRVIETSRRKKKMATVFHNRRWDGDFLTIRQLVESGAIGDVFKIECFMGNFAEPKSDWWRARKDISGGALHDWGAHFVDWILQLLPQKIESVSGFFTKKIWPQTSNEDHAEATIRFEDGRLAHVEFSSMAAAGKQRFRIIGTRGAIEQKGWDTKDGIRVITDQDGRTSDAIVPCQKSDWDAFYRNIADHLILGEPLIVTPESARKVIAVISLSEQSSKQGGIPVSLPFDQ